MCYLWLIFTLPPPPPRGDSLTFFNYQFYVYLILLSLLIVSVSIIRNLRKEIANLKQKLAFRNTELLIGKREIENIQRQLEDVTLKNNHQRLLNMAKIFSRLTCLDLKREDSLEVILDLALEIIPKAKYGATFSLEGNYVRITSVKGHRKELVGYLISIEGFQVDRDIVIVRNVGEYANRAPEIAELSRPISEWLVAKLTCKDEIFGYLKLDIPAESQEHFDDTDVELVRGIVGLASILYGLKLHSQREQDLTDRMLFVLTKTLEYYDTYTRGHSETVAKYAMKIAERLGLNVYRSRRLYWASLLHDIGKIYIPQSILNKPGRLSEEEYRLVKIHPVKSEELVMSIGGLDDIGKIIRSHHERWDDRGYPDGLKGEEIPLESRIICIADAVDAMSSDRPYRKGMTKEEIIKEIERCSGTQFDPELSKIMIEILQKE